MQHEFEQKIAELRAEIGQLRADRTIAEAHFAATPQTIRDASASVGSRPFGVSRSIKSGKC
jgi:hypothetical protein